MNKIGLATNKFFTGEVIIQNKRRRILLKRSCITIIFRGLESLLIKNISRANNTLKKCYTHRSTNKFRTIFTPTSRLIKHPTIYYH